MKDYFLKQIDEIKSSPKILLKKWYFWIIAISVVYGLITDIFAPEDSTITQKSDIPKENIVKEEKIETEEERIAREEKEQKELEEKAEKERKENIENTAWSLYATTEQVIKNRLKVPQTAKFSNQQAIFDEEQQIYRVKGDVAAENSFGGTVNSTFYAEYDNQLNIIYLVFDNEILVNTKQ